ncbi:hypothetical protein VTJ04DRAFT_6792 [Mycothermus thermophilus]|uniref:uncharacterized protein n=1 Tax=Humicola insolens TaxID=85995 RepID=UPI0037448C27
MDKVGVWRKVRGTGLFLAPPRHAGPPVQIASHSVPPSPKGRCVIGWVLCLRYNGTSRTAPGYRTVTSYLFIHTSIQPRESKPARKASCSDTRPHPRPASPVSPGCASIACPDGRSPPLIALFSFLPCPALRPQDGPPPLAFGVACLRCRRPDPFQVPQRPSLSRGPNPTKAPAKSPNLHSDRNPHHFLFHSGASPIEASSFRISETHSNSILQLTVFFFPSWLQLRRFGILHRCSWAAATPSNDPIGGAFCDPHLSQAFPPSPREGHALCQSRNPPVGPKYSRKPQPVLVTRRLAFAVLCSTTLLTGRRASGFLPQQPKALLF